MLEPCIIVRRYPYEEPDITQLHFFVSNGSFSAAVAFYCNVADIANIGKGLKNFPLKSGDEYTYTHGSEDPADNWDCFFRLRAFTYNFAGHSALEVSINLNEKQPVDKAISSFSIPAEPTAINQLGELFEDFSKLSHLEMQWNLNRGRLYVEHQPESSHSN